MSQKILHLTASERDIFEKLPKELRKGWAVEEEMLNTYESPEELHLRQEMFRRTSPEFLAHLDTFRTVDSSAALTAALRSKGIPQDVFLDMLFPLGAVFLRGFIAACLPLLKTTEALEEIAMLSSLRHALLESNGETISA